MADLTPHMQAITDEFMRTTQPDTLDRTQMRTRLIFDMFYDDEEGEPHQAIEDCITDLAHIAEERHLDITQCFLAALKMYDRERAEWEQRNERE